MAAPSTNAVVTQIQGLGSKFTASVEACTKQLLTALAGAPLDAPLVAKIISMMILTNRPEAVHGATWESIITQGASPAAAAYDNLPLPWNGSVFVNAVKDIVPSLSWLDVMSSLDHPYFVVRSKMGLKLLMEILLDGFGSNQAFPISFLYRTWAGNKSGQLSWLMHVVQHPDVFFVLDYPYRAANLSCLKVMPDENNKEIAVWKSLDLTEVFFRLSEMQALTNTIYNLLRGYIQTCPDLLLMSIVQAQVPMSKVRVHLIKQLVPQLLNGNTNAVPVLNYVWNSETNKAELRQYVLVSLASYYALNPNDQLRLTRILEIAHELKPNGLAELFNLTEFGFVIDLACLASRRDFLKLDKFLSDKLNEYGDQFAQQMCHFLKRRFPSASQPNSITQEVFQVMIQAIQARSSVSPLVAGELNQLYAHIRNAQMKAGDGRGSGARTPVNPPSGPSGYNPLPIGNPLGQSSAPGSSFPLFQQYGRGEMLSDIFDAQRTGGSNSGGGMSTGLFGNNSGLSSSGPFGMHGEGHNKGLGSGSLGFTGFSGLRSAMNMSPNQMPRNISTPANGFNPYGRMSATSSAWNPGALRSTPGASTPLDFRQMPPGVGMNPLGGNANAGIDFVGGSTTPGLGGRNDELATASFSEEVQEEANSYFALIYAGTNNFTVQDFVAKLKSFRNSPNIKDREVLLCVVKNLFDEYRFFAEYPERELKTTAEVYGGIIREGIVTNIQFATAVRRVIESLQSEPGSTLWTFGMVALNACRSVLFKYPKVCHMLMSNDNFARFPPDLKQYITCGAQSALPPTHTPDRESTWSIASSLGPSLGSGLPPQSAAPGAPVGQRFAPRSVTGASMLSVTNVDILERATERDGNQVKKPSAAIEEKVSFLCNNLSQSNLSKKTEEMRELMKDQDEEFLRWLAQYLVMKRVTLEQNFQPLYNNFLVALGDDKLNSFVKQETFRNIKILLRSDKRQAASNFGDRQLLKNLGHWLGLISVARDQPILQTDLDLKYLLLDAFYKGQTELLYVVPFVAKVLTASSKSTIFGPKCAWIFAIIKVLAEIHNEPDLKLNLKFEIEVLCKELNIDIHEVEITGYLKDASRLPKLVPEPGGPSPIPRTAAQRALTPADKKESESAQAAAPRQPTPQSAAQVPPQPPQNQPSYHYNDINTYSIEGLAQHIKIPSHIPIIQMAPHSRQLCRTAITHAVRELIGGIAERSINVAITATEHICRKDFSMDGDEAHIRKAAHQMMRAMTASMAAITCREPLATTILGYLRQGFSSHFGGNVSEEQKKMMEEAALLITEQNIEVATNFIVKSACEKAVGEVERRLSSDIDARRIARKDGRQFTYEDNTLELNEKLPESLRPKPGPMPEDRMRIYDDFSSKICGFKPLTAEDMFVDFVKRTPPQAASPLPVTDPDKLVKQFKMVSQDVDIVLEQAAASPEISQSKAYQAMSECKESLARVVQNSEDETALGTLVYDFVDKFLYAYDSGEASKLPPTPPVDVRRRLRELFVGILGIMTRHIPQADIVRRITRAVVNARPECKFNVEGMDVLLKNQFVNLAIFDQYMLTQMDNGNNFQAAYFAQKLTKLYMADRTRPQPVMNVLPLTWEMLTKIQQTAARTPDAFSQIGANAAENRPPSSTLGNQLLPPERQMLPPGLLDEKSEEGASELQVKVENILREWIAICYTPLAQKEPQQALAVVVHLMHEQGVLATDEMISKFFKMCADICFDVSYRLLKTDTNGNSMVVRQRCYYTLDAFVKLTSLMVKYSDGSQHSTKINLLKKVLGILTQTLHADHESRKSEFNGMPFHRILIIMFNELTNPDPLLEPIMWNILESFGQALFVLQPRRVPGFAFHWLDIIGHRNFIGRLLADSTDTGRTGAMYTQLILCHLKFLAPFLRNVQLPKSISVLYKGTLRVLLVILHDFPEILCEYHYVLCDVIPANCVQLRNLVLSAYPRDMRLSDPFTQTFEMIENLREMSVNPKMHREMSAIIPADLRAKLDDYLESRSSVTFLSELPGYLQATQVAGSKYNVTVMNAIVLYVGSRAIDAIHEKGQRISMATIAHSAYMDIFQNLAVSLCTEGRYLLFNAIANQLRYPNTHTHYFSCTLLYLFLEANAEVIQEQITRILFERLVALRPHPWGLLITFIELIRNPRYGFWKHDFVRCAPEIERLFMSVANSAGSCNVPGGGPSKEPMKTRQA